MLFCCNCSLVLIRCTLQELITKIGQSVKTIKAWKLYGRAQEHLVHLLRSLQMHFLSIIALPMGLVLKF
uniref:Uncharacterized protein n=1 Tax=Aegilops tauschii subsp. strangulata TaxID=200361 RepID=A0A452XFB4_AEGTS